MKIDDNSLFTSFINLNISRLKKSSSASFYYAELFLRHFVQHKTDCEDDQKFCIFYCISTAPQIIFIEFQIYNLDIFTSYIEYRSIKELHNISGLVTNRTRVYVFIGMTVVYDSYLFF